MTIPHSLPRRAYAAPLAPHHYPRIIHAFASSPWAILPEKLAELEAFLRYKAAAGQADDGMLAYHDCDDDPTLDTRAGRRDGNYQVVGRTAILPLFGVIAQRMNLMTQISGGTSTENFGQCFDEAASDKSVRNICVVVDSPGGSVFGVAELADKIYKARGEKKVVAVADSMAASAAYWLACQAGELVCTPGGQVGSVGVMAAHLDESKADELAGLKTTLIHAGKFKAEGDPSQPLDDEARANLQNMIDQYYSMFLGAVARGRGVSEARVEKDFGQGRMKLAKEALSLGMCDRVATLEKVLTGLGAGDGNPGAVAAVVNSMARATSVLHG